MEELETEIREMEDDNSSKSIKNEEFEWTVTEIKGGKSNAKIKAIGVGGGGGNMINFMVNQNVDYIDLIVANTDAQDIDKSNAPFKLQLGDGLGAGAKPEKGRDAALISFEDIKMMLDGSHIVFIAAGLGGGTGTGAAPIIAQAAKDVGALTVSVVTYPFEWEGPKKSKLAKSGLEELKSSSDSVIVIQNDRIEVAGEKKLTISNAFEMVDMVLAQAVAGISKIILYSGKKGGINLDFADVQTVMSHRGNSLMVSGHSEGENSGYEALKNAIESPLLNNHSIDGAMGALVHFDIHPDYPIMDLQQAMNVIYESVHEDADVIWGFILNEKMAVNEARVTIIITGFENKDNIPKPKVDTVPEKKERKQEEFQYGNNSDVQKYQGQMVVGGYNNHNEDIIDVPTFLRRQMD